jgi:hypothetical protein
MAWLGAALLAASGLLWAFDAARALSSVRRSNAGEGETGSGAPRPGDVRVRQDVARAELGRAAAPASLALGTHAAGPVPEAASSFLEPARARAERRKETLGPKSRRGRKPVRSPSPPPELAARACDPPTYMDAAGIRHFKKDCL